MTENELIGEIAECLQEALQLQSRVTEVTERAHQAAGMSVADRALRGKVRGLFFGLLAHLEGLHRVVREEILVTDVPNDSTGIPATAADVSIQRCSTVT